MLEDWLKYGVLGMAGNAGVIGRLAGLLGIADDMKESILLLEPFTCPFLRRDEDEFPVL